MTISHDLVDTIGHQTVLLGVVADETETVESSFSSFLGVVHGLEVVGDLLRH